MKKFNFIYLLMAFVGVIAMTSCEHPYTDYTPGAKENNQGVYFPGKIDFKVTAEDTFVEIPVARVNVAEAAEVSFRLEDVNEVFTYDSSVSFAADAAESAIKVEFDGAALVVGKKYEFKIQLDQAEATAYAVSEYTFSVMIPEPWISLGEGIYFDDCICHVLADATGYQGVGTYVEFQQHEVETHRIRVVNPFSADVIAAMWGGLPSWMQFTATEDKYLEFDITDTENVLIAPSEDLVELSDGAGNTAYVYLMSIYLPDNDYALGFWWDPKYPIRLVDGIIKFPTEGMALSAFQGGEYLGDFAAANTTGYMQYYLPGVEFVNYDMTANYGGMKVGADNTTTAAIINFGFGSDVESFKFAVVDGVLDDASAVIEGIVAGSEEFAIYEGNVDTFEYTVPVEGAGMKSVVAVPYAGGEAKADYACVYSFYFPGMSGGEAPEAEIIVYWDSVAEVTGNPDYEAQYPADQFVCLGFIANADEIRSIKYFIQDTAVIEGYGMTDAEIIEAGGQAMPAEMMAKLAEQGNFVLGPWQFNTPDNRSSESATMILAVETVYSAELVYFHLDYAFPTASAATTSARVLKAAAPGYSVLNIAKATLR